MKNLKKYWTFYVVFGLFFVYLLAQHFLVGLYHDDYGYLSLSYIGDLPISGTNYGLSEIFQFLGLHYQQWGGRIVGFFFEIFLGHIGIHVFQFFQCITILGTFILIYLIVTKLTNYHHPFIALFTVFSYGLFEIEQLRGGIYWMTASCLYMIPLFFFLAFVYLHLVRKELHFSHKIFSVLYDGILILCVFLATFSQEQIAVAVLVYVFLSSIVTYVKTKKLSISDILFCIASLSAFLILMLAPGNETRLSHPTSAPFYALSFYGKFRKNVPEIVNGIFGPDYRYFTSVFFLTILYCAYHNLKQKKGISLLNVGAFLLCIFMVLGQLMFSNSYFGYMTAFFQDHLFLLSLVMIFHLLVILYVAILYLVKYQEWTILYLVVGAIFSQGAMLVAPYYVGRCAIIFNIICFLFCLNVLIHFKQETKFSLIYILIPFILITSFNMMTIYRGYLKNYVINERNDQVLVEVSKRIKNGGEISEVVLEKLPDPLYSAEQPYQKNYEYIIHWMHVYYDIPSDVLITYE